MVAFQLREEILMLGKRHAVNGGKFTPDEQERWTALNQEYDRLQAHGEQNPLIGRDGGSITDGPKNKDYFSRRGLGEGYAGNTLDKAVTGWSRNQLGQPVGPAEIEACNRYGISAASNVFVVKFQPTMPMNGTRLFRNALSSQDGTSGGFTVPTGFMANLEQAMLSNSGILEACDVMRTATGVPMPWPTSDDTSNEGVQLGESAESTTLDPTFAAVVFGSYKLSSKLVKVPHELLRDNSVNLANELGTMLGTRIGRILNSKCTTGTGAATAKGIVTASTLGKTTASGTAIAFDELIDLMHSVDVSYRTQTDGFGWMMHDSIAATLRKLKDGEGNYLWQQSVQLGQPDRLLGWPVTINNSMDSAATSGAKTVLCGAFKKYKVRLVAELRLRRLVERYAEFDQEGFLAFQEFDGNLLDAGTHPVKYLVQA